MNGKGSAPRSNNSKAYLENYQRIFRKKKMQSDLGKKSNKMPSNKCK